MMSGAYARSRLAGLARRGLLPSLTSPPAAAAAPWISAPGRRRRSDDGSRTSSPSTGRSAPRVIRASIIRQVHHLYCSITSPAAATLPRRPVHAADLVEDGDSTPRNPSSTLRTSRARDQLHSGVRRRREKRCLPRGSIAIRVYCVR